MNNNYDSTAETLKHIKMVSSYISWFCCKLLNRANNHDNSKLKSPEKEGFDKCTQQLKGLTYGSDDYKKCLADLKPVLDHHYSNNSHHPEHYENGIYGMDLFDIVEMFLDWKAATSRHKDGCIRKSIEHNKKRFGISDQLAAIFINTVDRAEIETFEINKGE